MHSHIKAVLKLITDSGQMDMIGSYTQRRHVCVKHCVISLQKSYNWILLSLQGGYSFPFTMKTTNPNIQIHRREGVYPLICADYRWHGYIRECPLTSSLTGVTF